MRVKYYGRAESPTGDAIASATVKIYLAGTSTPATAYTSTTSTTPVSQVTTDTYGYYTFYINAFDYDQSQLFDLVLNKLGSATTYTFYNIQSDNIIPGTYDIDENTVVSGHVYIPKGVVLNISNGITLTFSVMPEIGLYTVFTGDGKVAFPNGCRVYIDWWGDDLATVVANIDTADATIVISDTVAVAENVSVPSNVCLMFEPPGKLEVANTYTVTIASLYCPTVYQIFDGAGTISLTGMASEKVRPEYWGEVTNNVITALAAGTEVVLGYNTYTIDTPISVPIYKRLVGIGYRSNIVASSVTGAAISLVGGHGRTEVGKLRISGTADTGLHINNAQMLDIHEIDLDGLTCTNGFIFEMTWGSSFRDLSTNGATISNACFLVGGSFNANSISNWYTSNDCLYSVYVWGRYNGGSGFSHGNVANMICVQNSKYGIYIREAQGWSINGYYSENIVCAVRLGDYSGGYMARSIHFSGGEFGGPYNTNSYISDRVASLDLDYAVGCSFSSNDFSGAYNCGNVAPLTINGDGSNAYGIAIVNPNGTINSAFVIRKGWGYTSATVSIGGAGASGAITATVAGSMVTELTVTNPGSGYALDERCFVPVRYNRTFRCSIISPLFNDGIGGDLCPMYPWIVRDSGADQSNGITLLDDNSWIDQMGVSCEFRKTRDYSHYHAVIEYEGDGTQVVNIHTPPVYPTP